MSSSQSSCVYTLIITYLIWTLVVAATRNKLRYKNVNPILVIHNELLLCSIKYILLKRNIYLFKLIGKRFSVLLVYDIHVDSFYWPMFFFANSNSGHF